MTNSENVATISRAVVVASIAAEKASRGRVSLIMGVRAPSAHVEARGGNVRGLPLDGAHRDLSRVADQLDRSAARLTVIFHLTGVINSVPYKDVAIWIEGGQVSLPTLFEGTEKARSILYGIGRAVRDELAGHPEIMAAAWADHVEGIRAQVRDSQAYLAAVEARAAQIADAATMELVGAVTR